VWPFPSMPSLAATLRYSMSERRMRKALLLRGQQTEQSGRNNALSPPGRSNCRNTGQSDVTNAVEGLAKSTVQFMETWNLVISFARSIICLRSKVSGLLLKSARYSSTSSRLTSYGPECFTGIPSAMATFWTIRDDLPLFSNCKAISSNDRLMCSRFNSRE